MIKSPRLTYSFRLKLDSLSVDRSCWVLSLSQRRSRPGWNKGEKLENNRMMWAKSAKKNAK
ncbi:hypothetical protein RvY_08583 [Ramazzottius varieornatus]|uniref:Uncharacterized protein n=1 Tax=Ramazzottius varieornatus TaxID=947166 RepID=A0A1D1V6B3_RAMVA|nr:hypothetical protein RvY_08583 [Ramazzottius varieornatus]